MRAALCEHMSVRVCVGELKRARTLRVSVCSVCVNCIGVSMSAWVSFINSAIKPFDV
jgi:hypothetical protein